MKKNQLGFLLFFICGLFCNSLSAQNPYLSFSNTSGNSSGFSIIEGNPISLRLNLSGAIPTQVDVNITTTSGTAGTSDFVAFSTTVTIPAGQTSSPYFLISTTNDALIEQSENFTVNAMAVSGNTSNVNNQRAITIVDNDTVPTVTTNAQTSATEGSYIPTVGYYLSNPYNTNVVINCVTVIGTAGASDFTAVNSSVTIYAGSVSGYTTVPITNDAFIEPNETFVVNGTVTSGNTTNSAISTTITIVDNDTTPTLTIYEGYVMEGQTANLYAVLDRTFSSDVVVNFVTTAGTAGTSDYTTTNITQTIYAGDYSAYVSIPTVDDALDEPREIFYINANVTSGNTTNASVTSQVKIIDNDGLPDLIVNSYGVNTQPQGGGEIYEGDVVGFYVSLSAPNAADTIVNVGTSPGTASNTDFTSINTTVTIPAGETYIEVQVPTTLDNLLEGTENFTFTATTTSGNTYNPSISIVADILDNYNVKANPDTLHLLPEQQQIYQ